MKAVSAPLWAALAVWVSTAFSAAEEIKVGDVVIEIPVPEGTVRIDGVDGRFDGAQKRKAPDGGVNLAIYGSEEDLATLKEGRNPSVASEFMLMAMYPGESVGEADFAQVITAIEEAQNQLVEKAKKAQAEWLAAAKEENPAATVKFEEPIPLGVTGKAKDWVSFGVRVKAEGEVDGVKRSSDVLSYNTLLLKQGKILGLRLTAEMSGGRTEESVEEAVDGWRQALLPASAELDEAAVPAGE